MARPRGTAAEREREAREQAQRKAKLSLRVGGLGIAVLFLSGLGAVILPDEILIFLGAMVVGIVLVLVALSLVWGFAGRLRLDDETKIW